jgi:hypothetical protein
MGQKMKPISAQPTAQSATAPNPAPKPKQRQTPGKTSGVTASDVAKSPDIGQMRPEKTTLVQSQQVGSQWIDHGAACDGKGATTAGCFLPDANRERLIIDFKVRVVRAATNYKFALTQLRFEELMQKEDDLNWVFSLALDLVGAHFITVAAKSLANWKKAGIAKLEALGERLPGFGAEAAQEGYRDQFADMLNSVSNESIKVKVNTAFTSIKNKASKTAKKAQNFADETKKQAAVAFIDQLTEQCDVGFEKFEAHATGSVNDAELVVLWDGLDPANHTVGTYKAELGEKIARFKRSGITELGRKQTVDEYGYENIHRDTRCVWLMDLEGSKTLWYQKQDGSFNPSVIKRGDPGSSVQPEGTRYFGARDPNAAPTLTRRVPDEFKEAALERSEIIFGPTPTIPDPSAVYVQRMTMVTGDPRGAASRGTSTSAPASQTPASPHSLAPLPNILNNNP